jgi:cell division septation protein DedD
VSEHDDPNEELYEEVPPRSIFAATWFRVVLVVIVIGVIGAVAIPYVLDWMNPPPSRPAVATKPPMIPSTTSATSAGDAAAASEKKDSTLIPAPAAPTSTLPAARPVDQKPSAPKSEPKTAAAPAPAPADTKSAMAVTETAPSAPSASTLKPQPVRPTVKPEPPAKSETTATPSPAARADTTSKSDATAKAEAKPSATAKPEPAAKPDMLAKADSETSSTASKDGARPAVAAKSTSTTKRAATTATTASAPAKGSFWVQVGAFKDAETARRLAAKLREDNFQVEESVARGGGAARSAPKAPVATKAPSTNGGSDHYDVFVTGMSAEELTKRLSAKGLAAEASGSAMVVKPSLPLRDAVALSKDLAVEGFKVQVRRTAGSAGPSAPSPPAVGEGGSELHRVRVGAFTDRVAAQEAARQLEAKGYKPYIARGDK